MVKANIFVAQPPPHLQHKVKIGKNQRQFISSQGKTLMLEWTDGRKALLTKLWGEGFSASQIAKEIGDVTRSAVIGKVHRLGLPGRAKTPTTRSYRPQKPAVPRASTAAAFKDNARALQPASSRANGASSTSSITSQKRAPVAALPAPQRKAHKGGKIEAALLRSERASEKLAKELEIFQRETGAWLDHARLATLPCAKAPRPGSGVTQNLKGCSLSAGVLAFDRHMLSGSNSLPFGIEQFALD